MKTLSQQILLLCMLSLTVPGLAAADKTVTTTTTTTTHFSADAPVYQGEIKDVTVLEELTLADFQNTGKPSGAFQEYQNYKAAIRDAGPDSRAVPYKINLGERTVRIEDFQAPGEPLERAQARYEAYRRVRPRVVDGREVRYVYVMHKPIPTRE